MLRVVRTVARDMQTDLRLSHWACERVKCPKPLHQHTQEEPNALTPSELGALFETMRATAPTYFPLFAVIAFTGLRFCHAHAIDWADLTWRRARSRSPSPATAARSMRPPAEVGQHSGALAPELVEVLKQHRAKLL